MISRISVVRSCVVLMLAAHLAPVESFGQSRTMGNDIEVGTFRLHIQIQQRRVQVQRVRGAPAAVLAATDVVAAFDNWEPGLRLVTISVAVRNNHRAALFSPKVRVQSLESPETRVMNADAGRGPGTWVWLYGSETVGPGSATEFRGWTFMSPFAADFQADIVILGGVPVPAGMGVTITSADGTSIRVPAGAVPYDALIDIERVPLARLSAPVGAMGLIAVVDVTFEPTVFSGSFEAPLQPFQISVPAASSGAVSAYLVAQQVEIDFVSDRGAVSGPVPQLFPVASAMAFGGAIVTAPPPDGTSLAGIKGSGLYAILAGGAATAPFGWVTGVVTNENGVRPGAVVSNSSNLLVAITDGLGRFDLFINGGNFVVFGFDPFLGQFGAGLGTIASQGGTVFKFIELLDLSVPINTRPGIRNSGFERGDLTSWSKMNATVRSSLVTSANIAIDPSEGQWMAELTTAGVGSRLAQTITVPAGVKTLKIDFNLVTEEFPERNALSGDFFRAAIQKADGDIDLVSFTVSSATLFGPIGDCFPGGDTTCGATGWHTLSIDLSSYANTATPMTLLFTLVSGADPLDQRLETHVFLDNMRFSTLWLDYNIVVGSGGSLQAMVQQIAGANELLSQAGINARLRQSDLLPQQTSLLDVNCTPIVGFFNEFLVLPTMEQVLRLSRSGFAWDLHVYRIRSIIGVSAAAIAVGPDDYLGKEDFDQAPDNDLWGILATADGGNLLAHEAGHFLISPQEADHGLEHKVKDPANFMRSAPTVPPTVVSPGQSAAMNKSRYLEL